MQPAHFGGVEEILVEEGEVEEEISM